MYYKIINGRMVFDTCKTIRMNDGTWVSNPSTEQIAEAEWQVYVPPEVEPVKDTAPGLEDVMEAVKKMLKSTASDLSDEEALEVAAIYPTWIGKVGAEVAAGERYWYDGKLYKVIQTHTVQEDWTPDTVPALFAEVSIAEIPEWAQPAGAQDAYMAGDKVRHNGKTWESEVDANVWEPGVYGWNETH